MQDNALAHKSQVAMAAATECSFEVLPHPSCSPSLAPSDFYLFPRLKTNLRSWNFGSNEGVIDAVIEYLGEQDEDLCFEGISKLEQLWGKCIKICILENGGKFFIPGYSEVHDGENFLIIPRLSNKIYPISF